MNLRINPNVTPNFCNRKNNQPDYQIKSQPNFKGLIKLDPNLAIRFDQIESIELSKIGEKVVTKIRCFVWDKSPVNRDLLAKKTQLKSYNGDQLEKIATAELPGKFVDLSDDICKEQ